LISVSFVAVCGVTVFSNHFLFFHKLQPALSFRGRKLCITTPHGRLVGACSTQAQLQQLASWRSPRLRLLLLLIALTAWLMQATSAVGADESVSPPPLTSVSSKP